MVIFVQSNRLTLIGSHSTQSINLSSFWGLQCVCHSAHDSLVCCFISNVYIWYLYFICIYTVDIRSIQPVVCEIHAALLLLLQNISNEY